MKPDPLAREVMAMSSLLIIGLSSTACNLHQTATAEPIPRVASEAPTGCPPASLVAPDVGAQDAAVIDSLRPTLAWSYGGVCPPDGYRIEVAPGGDFSGPAAVVGAAAADEGSWTPEQDLLPATRYTWKVAAVSAGAIGPYSARQEFWTGPGCGGGDLQPPQLVSPVDGSYVQDSSPPLDFDYPESACLQEWFSIQVSPDADFSTLALHTTVGPSTQFDSNLAYLADCTLYYWRVKAIFGEDVSGPYSAVSAFFTDVTGACAPHTGLPRIAGFVWADDCQAAGTPTPVEPPGCVWQEGGLAPDGVHQDTEPAMAGLLVRIAPGVCTSPDMGWTTGPTDEGGRYSQVVLPGTYCVWVFRDRDGNQAVLGAGRWTHPPGGYDAPVRYEIELDWGEERIDLDFAWWNR